MRLARPEVMAPAAPQQHLPQRPFSPFRTVRTAKTPDSPPREPALRGPRRRGVWGGSPSLPPPLPGPSRPLTGGHRGSCGGGSDSQVRPGLGTPGRIPFHPREASFPPPLFAGFMRGSPGIRRNPMRVGPRSGPRKGLPLREGELSRRWGTRAPGGRGVREAPFGALAPNEPPGAGSPHSEPGLPQDSSFGADQDGRGGAIKAAHGGI